MEEANLYFERYQRKVNTSAPVVYLIYSYRIFEDSLLRPKLGHTKNI